MLAPFFLLVGCDDDDNITPKPDFKNALVIASADLEGKWKIKEYKDDDDDDDDDFRTFLPQITVEFTTDSKIIVNLSNNKVAESTWSLQNSGKVVRFLLEDDNDLLDDLEDEWFMIERTATTITLIEYDDDSDDDDDDDKDDDKDRLVLERI